MYVGQMSYFHLIIQNTDFMKEIKRKRRNYFETGFSIDLQSDGVLSFSVMEPKYINSFLKCSEAIRNAFLKCTLDRKIPSVLTLAVGRQ